jgi:hypothetical protein
VDARRDDCCARSHRYALHIFFGWCRREWDIRMPWRSAWIPLGSGQRVVDMCPSGEVYVHVHRPAVPPPPSCINVAVDATCAATVPPVLPAVSTMVRPCCRCLPHTLSLLQLRSVVPFLTSMRRVVGACACRLQRQL